MKILCCKCKQEYLLEDNIFGYEGTDYPLLFCPHCGYKHLLDFIPLNKSVEVKKLKKLELGATYYVNLTATRIADANRADQSGSDDGNVIDWDVADPFIVGTQLGTSKGPIARSYKLRWRDIGTIEGTYHFDASDGGPTDDESVWTNDANAFNGSTADSAYCSTNGASDIYELFGEGTNAPASGGTITEVQLRIHGKVTDSGDLLKAKVWTNGRGEALGTLSHGMMLPTWSSWLTLTEPAAGWDWATVQALEIAFYVEVYGGQNVHAYKAEIRVWSGGSTFADVAATGKIKWAGAADTVLSDGTTLISGNKLCTGTPEPSWQDGLENEEDNILPDSGTYSLADEYYSEFQWGLNPADADAEHKYGFELYEITNGISIGECLANLTIAAAGGTQTSDTRGARTKGIETLSNNRSARTAGLNTASDNRSARTEGAVVSFDNRSARTTGIDTVSDNRSARTIGEITTSDNRGARSKGIETLSNNRNARIAGVDTIVDVRSARTVGEITTSDNRNACTKGETIVSDNRNARMEGTTGGTQVSDTRGARSAGVDIVENIRSARIAGVDTLSSYRNARIKGATTVSDNRSARTAGIDIVSSTRSARIIGEIITSDNRYARTEGTTAGTQVSDTRNARTLGIDTVSDNRSTRTAGIDTDSDNRNARIVGSITTSDNRNARTAGIDTISNAREARTSGSDISSNNRSARIIGEITIFDNRNARSAGIETLLDNRAARIVGFKISANNRSARATGVSTVLSYRGVRSEGFSLITFTEEIKLHKRIFGPVQFCEKSLEIQERILNEEIRIIR